ncbi:MAG: hypothetical protein ABIR24_10475 [Verrucomicrobiota bacterium]
MKEKQQQIWRWDGKSVAEAQDFLAAEEPLEIRVDNKPSVIKKPTSGQRHDAHAGQR